MPRGVSPPRPEGASPGPHTRTGSLGESVEEAGAHPAEISRGESTWRSDLIQRLVVVPGMLEAHTPAATHLLAYLAYLGERVVSQADIAAALGSHRATVGRLAAQLEEGGLLSRSRDAGAPWRHEVDPDLVAHEGRHGYLPRACTDIRVAGDLGLDPLTHAEHDAAVVWSLYADYDGRLQAGVTQADLATVAGREGGHWRRLTGALRRKGYLVDGAWSEQLADRGEAHLRIARRERAREAAWRADPAICGRSGGLISAYRRAGQPARSGRARRPIHSTRTLDTPNDSQSVSSIAANEEREPHRRTEQAWPRPDAPAPTVADLVAGPDPDAPAYARMATRGDWLGPDLAATLRLAELGGVTAARSAALEVDWRIRTGRHPVIDPVAMAAALTWCYSGQACRWLGGHECGDQARIEDRARRYDEQEAHHAQPGPVSAVLAGAVPALPGRGGGLEKSSPVQLSPALPRAGGPPGAPLQVVPPAAVPPSVPAPELDPEAMPPAIRRVVERRRRRLGLAQSGPPLYRSPPQRDRGQGPDAPAGADKLAR